jgi:hypothetical protein
MTFMGEGARRGAIVILLCLPACHGGAMGPVAATEIGAQLVDAECAYLVRCGLSPDVPTCKAIELPDATRLDAELKSGKVLYDAQAGGDCLTAVAAQTCARSERFRTPQACDDAFAGTVAADGACVSGDECMSGNCTYTNCPASMACCPGKCGPVVTIVAPGGDCSAFATRCTAGNFCHSETSGALVCAPQGAAGAPCLGGSDCVEGLGCVARAGQSPVCGAYAAHGQTCDPAGLLCEAPTDYCDPTTKKCVAQVAAGGDCAATATACLGFAVCDPTSHKCVAKHEVGGPCAMEPDCLALLVCMNGKCALPARKTQCP